MMTLQATLSKIDTVLLPDSERPVYQTTFTAMQTQLNQTLTLKKVSAPTLTESGFKLLILADAKDPNTEIKRLHPPAEQEWGYLRINQKGSGELVVSQPHLLFSVWNYLFDYLSDTDAADFTYGKFIKIAFRWNRPSYDSILTQLKRTARHFDWRSHIREYARLGHSHLEVNSLATPHGLEHGVPDEVYPLFYTYCPALDQFTYSKLNDGIYPREYLTANLTLLKKYAHEALKYGMTPGLLCFEPRNVPDTLLQKYPMLRGGRVDHPFRSLKPRFTLALSHPYVRLHYRELIQNLMHAVPELGYLSIVTNDSGAGFEYTRSLYVGANGGPYLIREWKSVEEVAKCAAKNVIHFFKLLRDAAAAINPEFRIITRLEPFATEQDYLLPDIGNRIDIEANSFLTSGYGTVYHHELYPEVFSVQGTLWQNSFKPEEKKFIDLMKSRQSRAHVSYSYGLMQNFDPIVGIPYPWMVYEKFKALYEVGADYVANAGGITPVSLAPWDVNREIAHVFQHHPQMELETTLENIAEKWVGAEWGPKLYHTWKLLQKSVRAFPPAALYASMGQSWYRIWVRPLIPNIEAIPEADRAYYERFMLATPHNPTRVDLNMDVLFELGGPDLAQTLVDRTDQQALPLLRQAMEYLKIVVTQTQKQPAVAKVFCDLWDRVQALECWYVTQRNVQAWIAGVHGYLRTTDETIRQPCQRLLKDMVLSEIENIKKLLKLWETSQTNFMLISDQGESVHIYGENFGELLARKIELMQGHENDTPYIDPNFIWRVPGIDCYSLAEADQIFAPETGQI